MVIGQLFHVKFLRKNLKEKNVIFEVDLRGLFVQNYIIST